MVFFAPASTTGSPAWAGIDLAGIVVGVNWLGFPRVGGDRPRDQTRPIAFRMVPPRGRG